MFHRLFLVSAFVNGIWQRANAFTSWPTTLSSRPLFPFGRRHSSEKNRIPQSPFSRLFMATWSDSKAVKDYQDFLASGKQELDMAQDCPSVIIKPLYGSTELADALAYMGNGEDLVLTPDQELPEHPTGYPVYITLPPTQLEDFLTNMNDSYHARPDDFVFFSGGLQYGNIEDTLKVRGYCRDSMTQVLISGLSVTQFGVADLSVRLMSETAIGEEKWAGECAACGKWAGAIAQRLLRNNIRCKTDFYREWRRRMWERSVYDAVFHLLGSVRSEPTTVEQVATYYSGEVSDMVWEFSQLLRGWKALTLTYGFEERMFGVAEAIGRDQPCTLIEDMYPYVWGNSVFKQSKMFADYLNYAQQEIGLLQGVELPRMNDEDFKSKMRQGNLRADGVI